MRVSNRQAAVRNHSTLTAGDPEPRGTNHSSRYERTANGVESTSLRDKTSLALFNKAPGECIVDEVCSICGSTNLPWSEFADGCPVTAAHQISDQRVGHGIPDSTHE